MEALGRYLPEKPLAPAQSSFCTFLRECCWTVDEARAGEERPWPRGGGWDDYFADIEDALLTCSPLLIDKTRRTMISNTMCAFDLWIASGGVDPRWPALGLSTRNRQVIIQALKLEGPAGSAEFLAKIAAMYRQFEERGGRRWWPEFPRWTFLAENATATNGGKIRAVPEGEDQARGAGTTVLHLEELGVWTRARGTISAALPSLRPYGHLVAVTTPMAGTFAADIRNGEVNRPPGAMPGQYSVGGDRGVM